MGKPENSFERHKPRQPFDIDYSRRDFLGTMGKTSVLGAVALSTASGLALLTNTQTAHAQEFKVLREVDAKFLGAILPAIITQAAAEKDIAVHLTSFDRMLTPVSADPLGRIRQMIDLVTGFTTRVPMTGTLTDWPELSVEQIDRILESWRNSAFELPRTVAGVMTQLTATAWYMVPEHQLAIGYPGPPKKIVE